MHDAPIAGPPSRTAWTLVLAGLGHSWPPWMLWSSWDAVLTDTRRTLSMAPLRGSSQLSLAGQVLPGEVKVQAGVHVQLEPAVGVDVGPEQRVERPAALDRELARPLWVVQDPLQQQGVDVGVLGLFGRN